MADLDTEATGDAPKTPVEETDSPKVPASVQTLPPKRKHRKVESAEKPPVQTAPKPDATAEAMRRKFRVMADAHKRNLDGATRWRPKVRKYLLEKPSSQAFKLYGINYTFDFDHLEKQGIPMPVIFTTIVVDTSGEWEPLFLPLDMYLGYWLCYLGLESLEQLFFVAMDKPYIIVPIAIAWGTYNYASMINTVAKQIAVEIAQAKADEAAKVKAATAKANVDNGIVVTPS